MSVGIAPDNGGNVTVSPICSGCPNSQSSNNGTYDGSNHSAPGQPSCCTDQCSCNTGGGGGSSPGGGIGGFGPGGGIGGFGPGGGIGGFGPGGGIGGFGPGGGLGNGPGGGIFPPLMF